MSIIITPGTFAPAPTPGVLRAAHWPAFPAPRPQRRHQQFQTRWTADLPPLNPPPPGEFDFSAMVVPGVAGWVARQSSTVWAHQRLITMRAEWVDMPAGVTDIAVWFANTPVAAGSTEIDVASSFQVLDSVDHVDDATGLDVWTPLLDGQVYASTGATTHPEIVYNTGPFGDRTIIPSTTAANAVVIEVKSGSTVLAGWYVSPVYSTSLELSAGGSEVSSQTSARAVRVVWSAEDGFNLLTPTGFLASPL
jgi:hypothetical protein